MYWIPFQIADYESDTKNLSPLEHGIYLLLLMHNWKGKPLPKDNDQLYRITSAFSQSEQAKVLEILALFFEEKSDGFWNKKAKKIHQKQEENYKKWVENGSKGGRPRKPNGLPEKTKRFSVENQTANQSESESNTLPNGNVVRPQKKPNGKTLISDDWQPSDNFHNWLRENRPEVTSAELAYQLSKMKDNHKANGRKYIDHEAAFRNWLQSDYYKPMPIQAGGIVPAEQRKGGLIVI